ncbi:MerR family transcriptional regulator [Actinotalea sp. K2]|uniref:MerR family transcriptional regulator n=1 Tax=Actinotalea sp. K2 TaxID=2939438 RepID=UPI0020177564|nr:MerR family transcriptional regulator [Actinotalea sp. K2]MCL3860809.1 MerR family DNA-binding protein [Actinotalea sp. K2]
MLIGEVARAAAVEVSTVRFYERRGLVRPTGRTTGNYRQYAEDTPLTVRFIRRAQRLGFTLAEVAPVLALRLVPDSVLREVLAAKRADLDQRIADLERMRDAIDRLAAEGVDPDAPCPVVASLATAGPWRSEGR